MNYMFDTANSPLSAANKLLIRCAWEGNPAFHVFLAPGAWPHVGPRGWPSGGCS